MAPVSGTRRQAWNVAALFAVAVFGVLAVIGPMPGVAQAAVTFQVMNANDSGAGSFRAAMESAQAASDPVEIAFDAPYEVMLLTSIATYSNGQALTIRGNGSTIRAVAGARALHFEQTAPNPGAVTIEGLSFKDMTFTGGGTPGGAIHFDRAEGALTLRNGTLENIVGYFWAGALVISQGSVLIDSVTFRGNSSQFSAPGAVQISLGSLEVVDSHFIDNIASGGAGAIGALWTDSVTITNTVMQNNVGTVGGALALGEGSLTVNGGSSLVGNRSTNGGGGAIAVIVSPALGPVQFDDVEMIDNEAALWGGAVSLVNGEGSPSDIDLRIRNAVFAGNKAGTSGGAYSGGAIAVLPTLTGTDVLVDVAHSTFARNSATGVGGAIHVALPFATAVSPYTAPMFLAVNSNFVENAAGAGLHGGALSIWGNTTLVYSTVHENAGASQVQTSFSSLAGGNPHGELFTFGTVIANPAGGSGSNCAVASWMTNFGHSYATDGSCAALAAQADPMLFFDADASLRSWPLPGSPLLDVIPVDQCLATNVPGWPSDWSPELWPLIGAAVPTTDLNFDQRGTERPQGAGCDIGAIEVLADSEPPAPRVTETSIECTPQPQVPGSQVDCTVTVADVDETGTKSSPSGSVTVSVDGIFFTSCDALIPSVDGVSSACLFNVITHSPAQVTVTAFYFGFTPHDMSSAAPTTVVWAQAATPVADVAVTIIPDRDVALTGADVGYEVEVDNFGPDTATGIVVSVAMPNGTTASDIPAACVLAGMTLTCSIASLANTDSESLAFTLRMPDTTGPVTVTAQVNANETDPNEENDTDSVVVTVVAPSADLAASVAVMSGDPDNDGVVTTGTTVGIQATATNNGPQTATNIVIAIGLPGTLTASSYPVGCTFTAGDAVTLSVLECAVAELENGGSASVGFDVVMPATAGSVTVQVTVSTTEADPNESNNNTTLVIQVVALVDGDTPAADAGGPYMGPVGSAFALDGSGSSGPDGAVLTFAWTAPQGGMFDDASSETPTFTATEGGVYAVTLTVCIVGVPDACDTAETSVVVYDPTGGFVTGGGWIESGMGAYLADPLLTGRANFGFVSRYQRGAHVPTGNTQFVFQAGQLNFSSTSYEWLVISGARAQFRGAGTLNGEAGYRFTLTVIDGGVNSGGDVDRFRIQIWDATGTLVYDNDRGTSSGDDPSTAISGGSIVIHSAPGSTGNSRR